jgi:hypothetical protein
VDLYQDSGETFGIQQISQQVQAAAGLSPYNSALDSKHPHSFLAARQGTRIAVLPIHTADEKSLFSELMKNETTGKPRWATITLQWNRVAENSGNSEIYYKVFIFFLFLFLASNNHTNIYSF